MENRPNKMIEPDSLEHPEIMTQEETLEELEENIKDAYMLMARESKKGSGLTY